MLYLGVPRGRIEHPHRRPVHRGRLVADRRPGIGRRGQQILAERAARAFIASQGATQLVTLLPVAVMGPVLGVDLGLQPAHPNGLRSTPRVPRLHRGRPRRRRRPRGRSSTLRNAAGDDPAPPAGTGHPTSTIATSCRSHLGQERGEGADAADRRSAGARPGCSTPSGRRGQLGLVKQVSIDKARDLLGSPRPSEEAIVAAGAEPDRGPGSSGAGATWNIRRRIGFESHALNFGADNDHEAIHPFCSS
ncbi:MAG: hypothetical protein QM756_41910 [Polyangiaceae bacterium]